MYCETYIRPKPNITALPEFYKIRSTVNPSGFPFESSSYLSSRSLRQLVFKRNCLTNATLFWYTRTDALLLVIPNVFSRRSVILYMALLIVLAVGQHSIFGNLYVSMKPRWRLRLSTFTFSSQ